MKSGRISPARKIGGVFCAQDWLRTACRVSTGKIYRATISSNRLVVARSARDPVPLARAEVDMDLELALDGWRPRLKIIASNAFVDFEVSDRAVKFAAGGCAEREHLVLSSSLVPITCSAFSLTPTVGMTNARFTLACTDDLDACVVGAIHLLCILLRREQGKDSS